MANRVLLPSQEYLQARLDYDMDTGSLRWRLRPVSDFNDGPRNSAKHACAIWNGRYARQKAGYTNTLYRPWDETQSYKVKVLSLNKQSYVCARVIYKIVTGLEPENIDHKDMNPENNCFDNLRPCSNPENGFNRKIRSINTAGLKGVTVLKGRYSNPYRAQIGINGKTKYLGTYSTAQEAHEAYAKAAIEIHAAFVRLK